MQVELDRGDLRILDVLQEHGDLSAADVAERVGMTPSTCWRRVSRLQELGVVKNRVAVLDREKVGLNVMVFSRVKLAGHGRDALLKFEQAVREHPEILECYTMMGETDFLLRIVCRDIKAYEAFFLDHLSRFPGVQEVNSSIAMAVVKETTALLGNVEGAVVKWANGFHSATTMMPEASYQLIREKVQKAVGRIKDFKPYKVAAPVKLDVRFKNYRPSEVLSYLSIVERIDAHSIRFVGKDMIEVSKFLEFVNTYEAGLEP